MTVQQPTRVPLLDLDLLKTLVAIVDTGNFSAAAEAVARTPSAISMQVKKMEDLVGQTLFVRESRPVQLTRPGAMLVEHGRRLLALNNEMIGRFVAPEVTGEVRLGAPDDVAERFLPEMLRRFSEDYPGVALKVVIDRSERMIDMVQRGDLDLSVITAEAGFQTDAGAEVIYREPLVWAGLSGGVAVEKTPLPLSVWEPHCAWRKASLEALDGQGRDYRIVFESAEVTGQRAAILADLAIAQIPVSSLGGRIAEIPARYGLPELPSYALGLMSSPDPTKPISAAIGHIKQSFSRLFAQRRQMQ
jgi:DNA-binding transcriptional LysR family regulator